MDDLCRVMINDQLFTAERGTLISQLLHHYQLDMALPCGANGKCGKCKIHATGELSPLRSEEITFLSPAEINTGMRLACCTTIAGDCTLRLLADDNLANIAVNGMGAVAVNNPRYHHYGLAIDIGTTTIAMKLLDQKGEIGVFSGRNGQAVFGADVISRIDRSLKSERENIKAVTCDCLNSMIDRLCGKCVIEVADIDTAVITGNTAMMYLLTGADPDCLAHTPFIADRLFGETMPAAQLGLRLADTASVYLCRSMAAYVGGDISCAVLASGMTEQSATALLVDIGTNGEMALWYQQQLMCCSTAAGPAFEGAEISQGMNAAPGAIDKVWLKQGKLCCHTIAGVAAKGICGSGIVDAISMFKQLAIIDESGAFERERLEELGLLAEINGRPACRIAENIYITQRDIRQVQLAKSAICAGIITMLDEAAIPLADIDVLYLAGGFGNYLNMDNAANIGLIPQPLAARTQVIGNAALQGAAMVLSNSNCSEKELVTGLPVQVLDLAATKTFMDNYVDEMEF